MFRSSIFRLSVPRFSPDDDGGSNNDANGSGNSGQPITFKDQADLDKFLTNRLNRDREAQKKATRKEIEDDIKAELVAAQTAADAEEQGKFEDLYKAEQAKVTKLEEKIDELKADIAAKEKEDLRKQVAAKHKIPEELAERLKGDTEEEMTTDAKLLAKTLKLDEESESQGKNEQAGPPTRRKPVETDTGKGTRPPKPTGEREGEENRKKQQSYTFVKEGDVSWGNA